MLWKCLSILNKSVNFCFGSEFKDIFDVDHFITSLRASPKTKEQSTARNGTFHASCELVKHIVLPSSGRVDVVWQFIVYV